MFHDGVVYHTCNSTERERERSLCRERIVADEAHLEIVGDECWKSGKGLSGMNAGSR